MAAFKFVDDEEESRSLEEWIQITLLPILDCIGYISERLEGLYQELK